MQNYVTLSIETHLFFARIMKEHALFLETGFPCKGKNWLRQAEWFRSQFEELHLSVVRLANRRIGREILKSDELVTAFTLPAEQRTSFLTGIPIDFRITKLEQRLTPFQNDNCSCNFDNSPELIQSMRQINLRALRLLNGLITFKENILRAVRNRQLFTANYPLLIEHILREARMYRNLIEELNSNRCNCSDSTGHFELDCSSLQQTGAFWNQIMMEHALFIRGLLDPCEEELIQTANDYACSYKKLLELAGAPDCVSIPELCHRSLTETLAYRDFKAAGTKGILTGQTASIILPLLADHVLREANHYIRLMNCVKCKEEERCPNHEKCGKECSPCEDAVAGDRCPCAEQESGHNEPCHQEQRHQESCHRETSCDQRRNGCPCMRNNSRR